MEKKFDKVKDFFEKQDYLLNRVNIEIRQAIIKEIFPNVNGKRILDMGCGDGWLSIPFVSSNNVVFLDAATQMIEVAKMNVSKEGNEKNATFVQSDILKYNDEQKFDIILCIGVISHIDDAEELIQRIRFLLKPDGQALIQFSDIDHFWYRAKRRFGKPDNYGYSLNKFNQSGFYKLVDQFGLRLKKKKGYFWQYPIMDRLKPEFQLRILNAFRDKALFSFLNSEWLVLFEKKIQD